MDSGQSHRKMRRAKREVTDIAELRSIIERAQVLRVGCVDQEGLFITPLSFGFDWEDGVLLPTLWVHSASEGRKIDAWLAHPEVALELDVPAGVIGGDFSCAYSYAFESIMATGRMTRVTFDVQKRRGLQRIMEHMAPGAPVQFADEAVKRVDVWRIDVSHLTGKRREGMPAGHGAAAASRQGAGTHPGSGARVETGEQVGADVQASGKLTPVTQTEVDQMLLGEKCSGCGMHCPLADPTCGRGFEARYRRLKQDGFELVE